MADRQSTAAGTVTFAAVPLLSAAVDWQAFGGSLSGDWSTQQHWSTDAVPGSGDAVVISDDGTATNPWLVTETSESAASLSLAMTLGTLEATTGLTVAGTLTQSLGTLLAMPETTISVGALDQTGGTVFIDDDGSGTTTLDSAGTDSVGGTVTLFSGAAWFDAALDIGTAAASNGAVTLDSGTGDIGNGFATLDVAGAVQIGSDPSGGDGGVGSLELDGGSVAYLGALSVLNDSTVSVDAASGIAVGASASSLATQGAIVVGTGAEMLADIATLGAAVINDGSFAVQPFQNGGVSAPGSVLVTGSLLSTGAVTVAAAATLNVAGSIELDDGSLSVGSGGALEAGSGDTAGAGVYLAGGQLMLDAATLTSFGSADFANSDATLVDGAVWASNTLSIAPGYSDGTTAVASVALITGSTLSSSDGLDVGNDPGVGTAATSDPGGVGTLDLSGGSTVEASSMAVLNGSLVSLDATSTVLLGSATAAEAGTVVVASDGLLVADIATVLASVDDEGTLDVAPGSTDVASDLFISGSLMGDGAVSVTPTGTLEVSQAAGFSGSVVISGGGELILDAGDMPNGTLTAVAGTASIDVEGQSFDSTGFFPTYDAATGQLVFGDAASQSTLEFAPGLALDDFSLAQDGSGTGTLVTETACFAAGTRIATDRGEVAVEALRQGDKVRLAEGGTAPVVWLGHRRVACRRHKRPADVQPVRISAHAFGLARPQRDLVVSADHAVFVEGVLIPVRYLLNNATVRQEDFSVVTYWHVELPAHAVLLAEGLPCESYLDTGNRSAFANGGGAVLAHPDFSRTVWQCQGCAPLVTEGPVRDLVYKRLLAQAFFLGWRLCDAGDGAAEWLAPTRALAG